jgi:hypothetical protein
MNNFLKTIRGQNNTEGSPVNRRTRCRKTLEAKQKNDPGINPENCDHRIMHNYLAIS